MAEADLFLSVLGFNPTLVRLRPDREREGKQGLKRFNPTLVRLRPFPPGPGEPGEDCFNPTLVRLRLPKDPSVYGPGDPVSIPRWFD